MKSCLNCYHFLSIDGEHAEGICKRYPPVLISGVKDDDAENICGCGTGISSYFSFPWTANEDRCGEFKAVRRRIKQG